MQCCNLNRSHIIRKRGIYEQVPTSFDAKRGVDNHRNDWRVHGMVLQCFLKGAFQEKGGDDGGSTRDLFRSHLLEYHLNAIAEEITMLIVGGELREKCSRRCAASDCIHQQLSALIEL